MNGYNEATVRVDELIKYQTFDCRVRPRSATGDGKMNEYGYKFEKDGSRHLVIIGQTNVYEKIQADKDSCDINKIIERFVAGDDSALNKVKGMYFDATDFPTNYAEYLQRQNDGNVLFKRLPIEIKEKFNNDPNEFWSTFGSVNWTEKLGILADEVQQTADSVEPVEKHIKQADMSPTPSETPAESEVR